LFGEHETNLANGGGLNRVKSSFGRFSWSFSGGGGI
jgi:hypothetical protein